jgi:hypothetical protein
MREGEHKVADATVGSGEKAEEARRESPLTTVGDFLARDWKNFCTSVP